MISGLSVLREYAAWYDFRILYLKRVPVILPVMISGFCTTRMYILVNESINQSLSKTLLRVS